jgi:hypothetical protein
MNLYHAGLSLPITAPTQALRLATEAQPTPREFLLVALGNLAYSRLIGTVPSEADLTELAAFAFDEIRDSLGDPDA